MATVSELLDIENKEIWKPIPGYNGKYEASCYGRIRSLDRLVPGKHPGTYAKINGKILSTFEVKNGYRRVNLCNEFGRKAKYVHQLVALSFLGPKLDEETDVNHKDENTGNNCVNNLEWCTKKYNANYGTRNKRVSTSNRRRKKHYTEEGYRHMVSPKEKAVVGINAKTGEIVRFRSIAIAGKHGLNKTGISHCITGRQKTHRGYIWRLEDGKC